MDFTATLPDETLLHILSYLRSVDPPFAVTDNPYLFLSRGAILGWLSITFVDRRWRRVAIGDATLWTHLDGRLGSQWANEFVSRSKGALLFIDDRGFHNAGDMFLYKITTAHPERVVLLYLNAIFGLDSSTIDRIMSLTFKNLEELNVMMMTGRNAASEIGSCNLLLQNAPRLRRLALYNTGSGLSVPDFNWNYPSLTQLVSLNFCGRATTIFDPLFLDTLRHMNSLAKLVIHDDDMVVHDAIPLSCGYRCSTTQEDIIYLQNLHSLVVNARIEIQAHLFRHIRLPPRARLALDIDPLSYMPIELYQALADGMRGVYDFHSHAPPLTSAYLSFNRYLPPQVFIVIGLARTLQPLRPVIELRWGEMVHEPLRNSDLTLSLPVEKAPTIFSSLPTDNVRFLTLHESGPSTMSAHLLHFPRVERLSFIGRDLHVMRVLRNPVLLPALRLVDLSGNNFDLCAVLTVPTKCARDGGYSHVRFPELEEVLEVRQSMDRPLQAIYLHVAEEIAFVRAGKIDETSCKNIPEDIVLQLIERLEAVRGVEIVDKDFDVFVA